MEMSKIQSQNLKEEKPVSRKALLGIVVILIAVGAVAGLIYLRIAQSRVYDENGEIQAPEIALAPKTPGILEEIYVSEGQMIPKNSIVARVGNELIKAKEGGLVILTAKETGEIASPSEPVVTMINPAELRVVARVEENKGFSRIEVGQRVVFTVDAFGSKEYQGVVDEIGSSSRESALSFNISERRPTKEFNVKIRFNISQYPELKNGMSAKVWIYK